MFDADTVRTYDQTMSARRLMTFRIVAWHGESGTPVGQTFLNTDASRPGWGFQEDTTVVPSHRGHRLGLALKSDMLLWLRAAAPQLHTIDTWNDLDNAPMTAVNNALGCRTVALGTYHRLHLA